MLFAAASWHPDPTTALLSALLTAFALPILYSLRRIILRYLLKWASVPVDYSLDWLSRHVMHSLAARMSLRRYCELQIAGPSRFLHVPCIADIKLDIDQIFVTLNLEEKGADAVFNQTNLLQAGDRIRVVGDPGSGKSSLVKRILRDACQRAIRAPRRSRLPVLVELKNFSSRGAAEAEDLGEWFYEQLRTQAEAFAVYRMGECFDNYAETEGILALLDGLDEVASTDYQIVRDAIKALSVRLSQLSEKSVMILTMRTQFHLQVRDSFRDTFPTVVQLRDFTPTDIYEFLNRWPFAAGQPRENNVERIYKELTDRPTLRDMCRNPLVLSMYVAKDQVSGHEVAPETRTDFYREVTDELIIRRRLKQTGRVPAATKLREQRERILGRLAFDHLMDPAQPTNSLSWENGLKAVVDVTGCEESQAERGFRELAIETGLVAEERPQQSFRFIHLTFCEFLAAKEAVQGQPSGWARLIEAQRLFGMGPQAEARSRLLEVIPFACGLLYRVDRASALDDVARLADRRLLARCFLETKAYDHPAWPVFVSAEREALLSTPESEWNDDWLRDLHLFNVVVNDANLSATHVPVEGGRVDLQAFFASLVRTQQESLSTLLASYAAHDAAAAFRLAEVCHLDLARNFPGVIIDNCDQIPFFSLILGQAAREPERAKRWASVVAEAGLRSAIVARLLSRREPPDAWASEVQRVPATMRWFRPSLIEESMYTHGLTIALTDGDAVDPAFPMLGLVGAFVPFGAARVPLLWPLLRRAIAVGAVGSAYALFIELVFHIGVRRILLLPFLRHGLPGWLLALSAWGVLLGLALGPTLARNRIRVRRFYGLILNLSGVESVPAPPTSTRPRSRVFAHIYDFLFSSVDPSYELIRIGKRFVRRSMWGTDEGLNALVTILYTRAPGMFAWAKEAMDQRAQRSLGL